MKILSVTAQKPNSTGSGVYLTELMRGFASDGIEQALICGVYKEDEILVPEGAAIYPVYFHSDEMPFAIAGMSDEMPYTSLRYCDMTDEISQTFMRGFTNTLQKAVEEFQPDLILCHHLYLLTALVREQYPDICVAGLCHGSDLRQLEKNPLMREWIENNIRELNQIFCLHEAQKKKIMELYSIDESKVQVIGSGYNSSVFFRTGCERKSDKKVILFAGKLSEKKGVFSLIKSMNLIHDESQDLNVELRLAGGYGNENEYVKLQNLIKNTNCEVTLLGRIPQSKLAEQMNEADIFILPSFYEGLPLVILEAAACGAKIICTDLSGIQDWINASVKDSGFVFIEPPKFIFADEPDETSLPAFEERIAHAIIRLLTEEQDEVDVTHLSWKAICDKIIETI